MPTPPLAECLARIRRMARGRARTAHEADELAACGGLALARCMRDYDGRGELWPWAVPYVRWRMSDALKCWTRRGRYVVSLPEVEAEGYELSTPERDVAAEVDLWRALARLRPRLRYVFLAHALGGWTLRELGECEGVTEARMSQLYSRARRELADALRV